MSKYTMGVYLRLDSATKTNLQEQASKQGLTLTAFIRMLLMRKADTPSEP